ncbi:DUF5703 domain-containing protein [Rubellicoccus peritrichatus]|uniref:DUF5703 domain-containing protein n=1 Tax=Rubellicoccus peritrichatus TaxID=3080537 RepID=A0AAQ3QQ72_9BACT|nr:DUF5703 domain-containing protein [Puniceicoccus sp. CR14]WOO39923.1 DUF5703 domain-containing protein [Puniceicoccus sp. CR14]
MNSPLQNTDKQANNFNVVWDSPSNHSGNSMPCGGYDIGLNVWVEDGDLLFYIDRSGSFDENHQMLKLGRVRLQLKPNPFVPQQPFRQELKLNEGYVEIIAGTPEVKLKVWVEVKRPVIHVEIESEQKFELTATYENWRLEPRIIDKERRHQTVSYIDYQGTVTSWPDVIDFKDEGVLFYHRNRDKELLIDRLIEQQELEPIRSKIPNTQKGRTFGGYMRGSGLIPGGTTEGIYPQYPYRGWKLHSRESTTSQRLDIYCHTAQTEKLEDWKKGLEALAANESQGVEEARKLAIEWWTEFNSRSYIKINDKEADKKDKAWQIGRNYSLFRYMLGCNARGEWPSKFNGHLFTPDPCYVKGLMGWYKNADLSNEPADYRQWGGGSFTAQNQRLVYWPLLKSGDTDMMPTQFDYYRRALPGAEARTTHLWGHAGVCFTEQLENFGLPIGWGWGWEGSKDPSHTRTPDLDPTVQAGKWVRYYYESQLEFSYMIVEYHRFQKLDISRWMPFIRSSVIFFDQHYRMRCKELTGKEFDDSGKYVFAPSKALETYEEAVNPLPIIAALQTLLPALLELPDTISGPDDRTLWQAMLTRLPELPTREVNGHSVFAPAETYNPKAINNEDPQMYAVFPYPIAHHGAPEFEIAQNTWKYDDLKKHFKCCWGQTFLWAARLGRTEEARELAIDKFADAPRRFPAFWGPGPDWVPDVDHGGSGMIGLQEMLMQTDGKQIHLLPAWPKDWDVDFKLHAPYKTTIEVSVHDGCLVKLKVEPQSRMDDVICSEKAWPRDMISAEA